MKKIFTGIVIALLLVQSTLTARAQQTEQKFIQELRYLLYLPDRYTTDTTQKWPLVLFLHGSGESGTDLQKLKVHGPPKLVENGKKFPFILISPQATEGWRSDQLMGLVRDVKTKYRVDNERVYTTGLSMGGHGTWALAADYPGEFAAIVPICGWGDTSKVWKLRHMNVWCFHGAKDNVVPLSGSEQMINALKAYNRSIKFTVYPEANHDSWTETYENEEVYTWLLSQKRSKLKEVAIKPELLRSYEGKYLGPQNDTLLISVKGEKLEAVLRKDKTFELKPAGQDIFFFDANALDDLRFSRDARGTVNGFEVRSGERIKFKKLQPAPKRSKV